MEITSISITPTPNRKRQIADVSIVFERSLLINNIRLINNGRRVFVEFSTSKRRYSRKISDDVIPLNRTMRNYIETVVISEYNKIREGLTQ